MRGTGKPMCPVTLANTAAGPEHLALRVKPGCDALVSRFGPVAWRIDRGQLVLMPKRAARLAVRGERFHDLAPHSRKAASRCSWCGSRRALERMKVDGKHTRTIWLEAGRRDRRHHRPDPAAAPVRDGRGSTTVEDAARAIRTMQVRGAPLIGAAAAYGMCAGAARGCLRRGARARLRAAARDAADRDQSANGRSTR